MNRAAARNTVSIPKRGKRNRPGGVVSTDTDDIHKQKEHDQPGIRLAANANGDLDITVVSPSPRHISDEEVLFWLKIMPPQLIALIENLDCKESATSPSCKEEPEQLQYYQADTQKGGAG